MNYIVDKLVDGLNEGNILIPILIAAVALIFNFKKVFDFFETWQKARVKKLSEALKCEHISGPTKSHLEEELATEHFNLATGMRMERGFREAVILAHKNTQGELRFVHFKRALPHLTYRDAKLGIEITRFDLLEGWFNAIFGGLLALMGVLIVALSIGLMMAPLGKFQGIDIVQAMKLLGTGGLCIAFAILMLSQLFPVNSARKVAKELEKQRNNPAQPPAA